jgi:hypothetical protein
MLIRHESKSIARPTHPKITSSDALGGLSPHLR